MWFCHKKFSPLERLISFLIAAQHLTAICEYLFTSLNLIITIKVVRGTPSYTFICMFSQAITSQLDGSWEDIQWAFCQGASWKNSSFLLLNPLIQQLVLSAVIQSSMAFHTKPEEIKCRLKACFKWRIPLAPWISAESIHTTLKNENC